jgi:hypothetical protein
MSEFESMSDMVRKSRQRDRAVAMLDVIDGGVADTNNPYADVTRKFVRLMRTVLESEC